MRYLLRIVAALAVVLLSQGTEAATTPFQTWLEGVRTEALSMGMKPETLDRALKGVQPIPRVIELDRRQPEFTLTFEQYINRVVPDARVKKGRQLLVEHEKLLADIAKKYGVQPRFIVALWGIETDFGRVTGGFSVVEALATLAYDGRRSAFFRRELMFALQIVDQGHIEPERMLGSWAGAMGQNQFMPSSFHSFAVDYDGDGHKNIWTSLPDVFASIANYLSRSGWKDDRTWGRPVVLPDGFDAKLLGGQVKKTMREWEELGVRRLDGGTLPKRDIEGGIVVPEKGKTAPAFLVYSNYDVILKWNRSSYFAVGAGSLADALAAP